MHPDGLGLHDWGRRGVAEADTTVEVGLANLQA